MTFSEYLIIQEAAYAGNVGIIEMVKFYQVATAAQKKQMKEYIDTKMFELAWKLLSKVTGTKLHEL